MNKNLKTALIVGGIAIAILVIVLPILGGLTAWQGGRWGMMGPGIMGGFGGGWFMPIVMIVFWGLVIWGIVALIRGLTLSETMGSARQADSALEILKRRYAQGEVSKTEFEEKKKDLV